MIVCFTGIIIGFLRLINRSINRIKVSHFATPPSQISVCSEDRATKSVKVLTKRTADSENIHSQNLTVI